MEKKSWFKPLILSESGIRRSASSLAILGLSVFLGSGCFIRDTRWIPIRPSWKEPGIEHRLLVTGYCKCGSCCGWERNWYGLPVNSSGASRGKRKHVAVAASGVRAKKGSIAADTDLFPFGTVMYVPGYGYGRVEDRGGDIKGYHIDLYFNSHRAAQRWGRQQKRVKVWPPR